jgi:formylglycine-generating enzyme required for sulfatase activity
MNKIFISLSIIIIMIIFAACGGSDSPAPTNPFVLETIIINVDSFQMGNTGAYSSNDDDKPLHKVILTKSLIMSKYEITLGEWKKTMGVGHSSFRSDSFPIDNASWKDAILFCNQLSQNQALSKCYEFKGNVVVCNWNANGWRLPTEAEWEYACKAGTATDFYNGNLTVNECSPIDPNLNEIGWYCSNSSSGSHLTGFKQPNSFGLYDMLGNVAEWCWDYWGPYSKLSVTDPKGLDSGTAHVLRGGAWYSDPTKCRSSFRDSSSANIASFGFRICRVK